MSPAAIASKRRIQLAGVHYNGPHRRLPEASVAMTVGRCRPFGPLGQQTGTVPVCNLG